MLWGSVIVFGSVVFVFFSSRRRHTRLQGDWSSDVCSSDLGWKSDGIRDRPSPGRHEGGMRAKVLGQTELGTSTLAGILPFPGPRHRIAGSSTACRHGTSVVISEAYD